MKIKKNHVGWILLFIILASYITISIAEQNFEQSKRMQTVNPN